MARLWDKGEPLNQRIHRFTVGSDPVIDREIMPFDILGSAAHVKVLAAAGLIDETETAAALGGLKQLYPKAMQREIEIPAELEDCHSVLEGLLTEQLGELGKKIHTGRSRNDQVLVAVRLYLKDAVLGLLDLIGGAFERFQPLIDRQGALPLPGYTHFQPAMPSSVALWAGAYQEHLLDHLRCGLQLHDRIDANPLGAASGFGVPLELNREIGAAALGFARVSRNPMHTQNSRGAEELAVVRWLEEIGATIEKWSSDLMLFTMDELKFVTLPAGFTTGSSIMPQKRNPDVIELMRASASKIRGAAAELSSLTAKLPSSYHRDFQLTKEPVVRSLSTAGELLLILGEVLPGLNFDPARLEQAMQPELYATYAVYAKVRAGTPFRDAYGETAKELAAGTVDFDSFKGDFAIIERQLAREREAARNEFEILRKTGAAKRAAFDRIRESVFTPT